MSHCCLISPVHNAFAVKCHLQTCWYYCESVVVQLTWLPVKFTCEWKWRIEQNVILMNLKVNRSQEAGNGQKWNRCDVLSVMSDWLDGCVIVSCWCYLPSLLQHVYCVFCLLMGYGRHPSSAVIIVINSSAAEASTWLAVSHSRMCPMFSHYILDQVT